MLSARFCGPARFDFNSKVTSDDITSSKYLKAQTHGMATRVLSRIAIDRCPRNPQMHCDDFHRPPHFKTAALLQFPHKLASVLSFKSAASRDHPRCKFVNLGSDH